MKPETRAARTPGQKPRQFAGRWLALCAGALGVGWLTGEAMREHAQDELRAARRAQTSSVFAPGADRQALEGALGADRPGVQSFFGLLWAPESPRQQIELFAALLGLKPQEIAAAVAVTLRMPEGRQEYALELLFRRWAEIDPAAAAARLRTLAARPPYGATRSLVEVWARVDPGSAREWVLALPPGSLRENALTSFIRVQSSRDPVAALQILASIPPGRRSAMQSEIFGAWALVDPETATSQALALPPGASRQQLLGSIAGLWASVDPPAALARFTQMPAGQMRRTALDNIFQQWIAQDAAAAADFLLDLPEDGERTRLFAKHGTSLLLEMDLDQALEILPLVKDSSAIRSLGEKFADENLPAALAWVDQLPEKTDRVMAMIGIAEKWAVSAPRAAAEHTLQWPDFAAEERQSTLVWILGRWVEQDAAQAISWADALADEDLRGSVLNSVVADLPDDQLPRTTALLEKMSLATRSSAMERITDRRIRYDLMGTVDWLKTLPEDTAKENAVATATRTLTDENPDEMRKWLEEMPPGPVRNAAAAAFVTGHLKQNAEEAVAWAARIPDAQARMDALRNGVNQWMFEDWAAAARWLKASPLFDEETKKQIMPKQ